MTAAEEREEKLRAELAAAGDPAALRRLARRPRRAGRSTARRRPSTGSSPPRRSEHAEAEAAVDAPRGKDAATALEALEEAREAYQTALALDRAGALRPHLQAGRAVPGVRAAGLDAAERRRRATAAEAAKAAGVAARKQADTATAPRGAARPAALRDLDRAVAGQRAQADGVGAAGLSTLDSQLAGAPDAGRAASGRSPSSTPSARPATTRPPPCAGPARRHRGRGAGRRARRRAAVGRPGATSTRPATRWRRSARRRPTATTWPARGPRWPRWARTEAGRRRDARDAAAARCRRRATRWRPRSGRARRAVRRRRRCRARRADSGPGRRRGRRAGRGGPAPDRGAHRRGASAARRPGATHERDGQVAQALAHPPAGRPVRAVAARRGARRAGRRRLADPARAVRRPVRPRPRQGRVLRRRPPRRRAAPGRAHAVRRRDVPGVAGPGAGPVRAAGRACRPARRSLESIVLDEGFGTLDAATLDTVAATLENLAARGDRMVGVVTHVRRAGRADPGAVRGQPRRADGARWNGRARDEALRGRVGPDATGPACGEPRLRRSAPASEAAQLDLDVEVPAGGVASRWSAPPDVRAPDVVLLVDGVRRIDARVWVERRGRRCAPRAGRLVRGRRGPLRPAPGRGRGGQRPGRSAACSPRSRRRPTLVTARRPLPGAAGEERRRPTALSAAVQPQLQALESTVLAESRDRVDADDLLVVDGPLRGRAASRASLGYVKTPPRSSYLPPAAVHGGDGAARRAAQPGVPARHPWHRYTWYLRLPGPAGAPWAGVVRVECSADLPAAGGDRAGRPVDGHAAPVRVDRVQGPARAAEPRADRRAGASAARHARRRSAAAPGAHARPPHRVPAGV